MTKTREISDILTGVDIEGTITATGSISSTPQGTLWGTANDGSGSGLDADTVDGLQASQFLRSDVADTAVKLTFGTGNVQGPTPTDATTGARLNLYPTGNGSDYTIGIESGTMWFNSDSNYKWYVDGSLKFEWDNAAGQLEIGGNKVWTAGNDGGGSGLDADLLDGLQYSQFLRSDISDTMTGNLIIDNGTNSTLSVISDDTGASTIAAYGSSQGTGIIYVGQSGSYGGGIEYNGDGSPSTIGLSDYIALFRRENGVDTWTARNFYNANNWDFRGNITAYASDKRLKENIEVIPNALDKVCKLRGVTFDWKDDCEDKGFIPAMKHETGVIAQEVQAVIPDAAVPAPFNEEYLTVKHEKIIPVLIEAIKELKAEVEQLKSEK